MSAEAHSSGPGYVTIWVWLVVLLLAGFIVFEVEMSKTLAVCLLFGIALVKAYLVVRHYMHLKNVPPMLYVVAGVPILLAIGMVISLIPDIGHNYRESVPAQDAAHGHP